MKRIDLIKQKISKGIKLNKSDLMFLNRAISKDKTLEKQFKKNTDLYNKIISVTNDLKELEFKRNYIVRKLIKPQNKQQSFVYSVDCNLKHYYTTKNRTLTQPIDNGYLLHLIDEIDFNVNNDYIIGLYNLLTDNNYNTNGIGLKVIIAKYLNSLKDLSNLKVFKIDNNKLNRDYRFLVYRNGKTKNYTKLYYNSENNLIIFNTMKNDNIVSVVLYDASKIKNVSEIVLSGVIDYDIDFKHIENLKDYQKKTFEFEENYKSNKEYIEKIFNFRYNTKSVGIKLTYKNIVQSTYFINEIYRNDILYQKYIDCRNYEKQTDNFQSNDLKLLITTLEDYENFNIDNLFKGCQLKDIQIKIDKYNRDYRLYMFKKVTNNYIHKKNIQYIFDFKPIDIKSITNNFTILKL